MKERKIVQLNNSFSVVIKGIAITLMILHHGLGLPPQWFEEGLGYGQIYLGSKELYMAVGNPLKICVSLFAFLTGYSCCMKKQFLYEAGLEKFKYGIKKSWSLMIKYWAILFIVFYPMGYIINGHIPGMKELIFNVLCVHQRAVSFSWYVLFYAFCMCSVPILVRMVSNNKVIDFIGFPVLCTIIVNLLDKVVTTKWYLIDVVRDYFYWMPIVWVGYLFAHYNIFEKLSFKINSMLCLGLMVFIPILRGWRSELFRLNLDVVYAPLYIIAILILVREGSVFYKAWMFLGKYSMYMWFLHALFFWEKTRPVFQPIVYGNQNIVVSILLLLGISLLMAIIWDVVVNKIGKILQCVTKNRDK